MSFNVDNFLLQLTCSVCEQKYVNKIKYYSCLFWKTEIFLLSENLKFCEVSLRKNFAHVKIF